MNVLVYSGPETLQLSFNHALTSLRAVLLPHYTVQIITASALQKQPWKPSCALLVLPQSLDAHREGFVSSSSKQIKEYVEGGGKCLMFGTRATVQGRSGGLGLSGGLKGLTLGLESGEDAAGVPLRLFDQARNRRIGFGNEDDAGDTKAPPSSSTLTAFGQEIQGIYHAGLGRFEGFEVAEEVSILGRFPSADKTSQGPIAGLKVAINEGELVLWGPNVEFPLTEEPAASLTKTPAAASEEARQELLRNTLISLGLSLPSQGSPAASQSSTSRPLPQFLVSSPRLPVITQEITSNLENAPFSSQLSPHVKVLKNAVDIDEFHFHSFDSIDSKEILDSSRTSTVSPTTSEQSTKEPKKIIVCRDGQLPEQSLAPLFNFADYFSALDFARERQGLSSPSALGNPWGMGEALLYGEVVGSTQTLFDNNPTFSSNLPTPILSLASHQLAGRGRGANVWLSPAGCLQFSLLLRVPLKATPSSPGFHLSKLVFIQYLFALAVVEACRDDTVLGEDLGSRVRIKWPNDIYADVGINGREDLKKIGGILVNTSIQGGLVTVIVGCGVNVLNPPPIASLLQLQNQHAATNRAGRPLGMERTAAAIVAQFEKMWDVFISKGSFEPFLGLYLKRWLHFDQLVTLTTTSPPMKVRIVGITADHGLLRTLPERRTSATGLLGSYAARVDGNDSEAPAYVDLQPDGNSFDLMAGLIRTKT